MLALADRSADWVDQALRDLEQAVLPQQDWQPAPPEGLEDRLRLLDGFYIPTLYPDSYPEGTPGEHFGRLQSEQALLHARAITEWIRAALASRL